MERMTWMTEERNGASATGALLCWRVRGPIATGAGLQGQKRSGFVPLAFGPDLVRGSSSVAFHHTNDHVAQGRTACDGTPLGSSGAGYG